MSDYRNKNVVLFGLGTLGGGVGSATYFARKDARVIIVDQKSEKELASSIQKLSIFKNITYRLGPHKLDYIKGADLIIPNPGVDFNHPILDYARTHAIPIKSAEALLLQAVPNKKTIGITGTRGKSTTTMMIAHVLKKEQKSVAVAGNMKGTSSLLLIEAEQDLDYIVLELSSWQLAWLGYAKLSPHIAVMTNIYPDHLNRYNSMEEYIQDKTHIFSHQKRDDFVVVNKDDPVLTRITETCISSRHFYSSHDWPKDESLRLFGEHNAYNAAACLACAELVGISKKQAVSHLKSFIGLPGRLEKRATLNGVDFINDTTSTTPVAACKAIQSFPKSRIILIMGGNTKNLPFEELVRTIKKYVRFTIVFEGTANNAFRNLNKSTTHTVPLDHIEDAVQTAYQLAKKGDTIIFSPGATHLPVLNEFERGDRFNHAVHTLIQKTKTSRDNG